MTKTIAILGAGSAAGAVIANELAGAGYFLLLMDKQPERSEALRQTLLQAYPLAMIEVATCERESAWEADVIVLAVSEQEQAKSARAIRDVVTGKRLIRISSCAEEASTEVVAGIRNEPASLEAILPYTCIINTSLTGFCQQVTTILA